MSLDTKHPLYIDSAEDWDIMNDTLGCQRAIKLKTTKYLPVTAGMIKKGWPTPGMIGTKMYAAYIKRALYHGFVLEATNTLVGVMHHKPATIELPKAMEPMRENATVNNESLEMLLRRINKNQLAPGRYGLFLDLPSTPTIENVLPYIATYKAKTIINWDDGTRDNPTVQNLNLVVLDETEHERQTDFSWEEQKKFRVLALGDIDENEGQNAAVYKVGLFKDTTTFDESVMTEPVFVGRKLNKIPFVFVNANDILPTPDTPPLLDLANLSIALYMLEADYRQSLFMQSQDTLVVIGGDRDANNDPVAHETGANASIDIKDVGGDAKFIGVESSGLSEQREAVSGDKKDAAALAGQLLDSASKGVESGEALQIRVAARTATLNSIALTGAFALQTILRIAAEWIGADPEEVIVTPNLDFADQQLEGKTLVDLMSAKLVGAPLSIESIHNLMQDKGLTKFTLEQEIQKILGEDSLSTPPSANNDPIDEVDNESDNDDI